MNFLNSYVNLFYRSKLNYILIFMLLTPSITLNLISGIEIFPWGFFFSIFYFYKILSVSTLIISFMFPWIFWGLYSDLYDFNFYRSLVAYFNVLFVFFIVVKFSTKEEMIIIKFIKIFFGVSVIIGLIQYYFNIEILENVVNFLVPRASNDPSNNGIAQRGVSALSSEPSRLGLELILFLSVILTTFKTINWKAVCITFLVSFFIIFINKSMTGIVFSTLLLCITVMIYLKNKAISIFKSLFILLISFFAFIFIIKLSSFEQMNNFSRVTAFIYDILKTPINETQNIYTGHKTSMFWKFYDLTGLRISSQLAVYMEATWFGYGIGNSQDVFQMGILNNPILRGGDQNWFVTNEFSTLPRPSSFISGLVSEFGLVGLLCFCSLFYYHIRKCMIDGVYIKKIVFIIIPLFSIFFLGTSGSPITFLCLSLILRNSLTNKTRYEK